MRIIRIDYINQGKDEEVVIIEVKWESEDKTIKDSKNVSKRTLQLNK